MSNLLFPQTCQCPSVQYEQPVLYRLKQLENCLYKHALPGAKTLRIKTGFNLEGFEIEVA